MLTADRDLNRAMEDGIHSLWVLCCVLVAFRNHLDYEDMEVHSFGGDAPECCLEWLEGQVAEQGRELYKLYHQAACRRDS